MTRLAFEIRMAVATWALELMFRVLPKEQKEHASEHVIDLCRVLAAHYDDRHRVYSTSEIRSLLQSFHRE